MVATKRLWPSSVAVIVLVLLSACGFQLRGSVELPPVLSVTMLQSNDPWEGVAAALRIELESAGAEITTRADDATAVLKLTGERSQRRVLSVGSAGRASEYELFEEIRFSLQDSDGGVLLKKQTLNMTRDLVFDENQLLGKVSEAEVLREQMRRALARQIITRIRASLQTHEPAAP